MQPCALKGGGNETCPAGTACQDVYQPRSLLLEERHPVGFCCPLSCPKPLRRCQSQRLANVTDICGCLSAHEVSGAV